ncbi:MAG: site-specific integrase [Advenella sp.]|uniref:Tyr recombinase domain-containing protein n=1 Tax=Advenella kashmirensis TaxID=310575 RepID=A0A356LI15_9BURK|nr:hypothetical protein [Advenella kashmirensis]
MSKDSGILIRCITKQQALLEQIKTPWMNDVCSFALSTDARMSEILKLEWSQFDLALSIARVTADKAPSGRSRSIPLNSDAMAVRKRRDKKWVFTTDTGVHPSDINRKGFKLTLTKANIEDFHFHDLRHTWAS